MTEPWDNEPEIENTKSWVARFNEICRPISYYTSQLAGLLTILYAAMMALPMYDTPPFGPLALGSLGALLFLEARNSRD